MVDIQVPSHKVLNINIAGYSENQFFRRGVSGVPYLLINLEDVPSISEMVGVDSRLLNRLALPYEFPLAKEIYSQFHDGRGISVEGRLKITGKVLEKLPIKARTFLRLLIGLPFYGFEGTLKVDDTVYEVGYDVADCDLKYLRRVSPSK